MAKTKKSENAKAVRIACQGAASIPIDELKPFQGELKTLSDDNYARLRNEIVDLGFSEPIAVWKSQGENFVLNGHQRLTALLKMREEGFAVPPVPVSIVDAASYKQAKLKVLSLTSQFGEMSPKGLLDFVADIDLKLPEMSERFDFPDVNLDAMMKAEDDGGVTDEIPPTRKTKIKRGDLFELGKHRLLCGDSTNEKDVERLMGRERAGLMNTDPPYGVDYSNADRPNPGVAKPRVAKDDLQDKKLQSFLEKVFKIASVKALLKNSAWYMWHAHLTQGYFAAAAAAADVILHRQIIWVKSNMLLGRGHYHWKHEPCFMGWIAGNSPPNYGLGKGERTQTTVWEISSISPKDRKEFNHSTPKPVALFEIPIIKHLKAGEIAYEPFAGTGPQFIAAEKLNRRCYGIEIEPIFCQVIIDRWEKLTGKKSRKL